MLQIFADTSAWVALFDEKDRNFKTATDFFQELKQPLLITNFILNETITLLRCRVSHKLAVEVAKKFYAGKMAALSYITPQEEADALKLFEKYTDKTFSFTDCTSFVVMRKSGIVQAFTFDKHFRQMGFQVVP